MLDICDISTTIVMDSITYTLGIYKMPSMYFHNGICTIYNNLH